MHRVPLQLFHAITGRYRLVRFIISGGMAAATQLSVFFVLTELVGLHYLYAATLGFVGGFVVSFTLQKYWTFKERSHRGIVRQGPRYLLLAVFNLLLNDAIIYVLVEWRDMVPLLAQILASVGIAFETFFLSKRIFRTTTPTAHDAPVVSDVAPEPTPAVWTEKTDN